MLKNILSYLLLFLMLPLLFNGCIGEQSNNIKDTHSDERELQEQIDRNYDSNIEVETKALIQKEKKYALSKKNEKSLEITTSDSPRVNYDDIYHIKIPVLMYHSIDFHSNNSLVIHPKEFAKQLKWLKDNEFTPLSLEELYDILTTGKDVPIKPVAITFDDGYEDNYLNAFSELKKYKFKATIFIITSSIDQPNFLKTTEIKDMYENNIDFQSHTENHVELNLLNYERQLREMEKSKETLKALLNKNIIALCYPVGKYNENTIKAAKNAGYKLCFTTRFGFAKRKDGLYKLTRIRMSPGINMEVLK